MSMAHQFGALRTIKTSWHLDPDVGNSHVVSEETKSQGGGTYRLIEENSLSARTLADDGSSVATSGQLPPCEDSESASPERERGKRREHRADGARHLRARSIAPMGGCAIQMVRSGR